MKLFAVIGNPVLHSKSPQIHVAGYKAQNVPAKYLRVAARDVGHSLRFAAQLGISGLNVTAPFKTDMVKAVSALDIDAKITGSVNTVLLDGDSARGFNTDVYGVVQSVKSSGLEIKDLPTLILGGGGAARSAIYAMVSHGAHVCIANRTFSKAQSLANEFGAQAVEFDSVEMAQLLTKTSLLINTISQDLELRAYEQLHKELTVMDARYTGNSTLIARAKAGGAKIIDGREWLLYQGARAYELFLERDAPIEAMRKALYEFEPQSRPIPQRIALVGLMGVGKSSTASTLCKLLDLELRELDDEVELVSGLSIAEICAQHGEATFRDFEERALSEALNRGPSIVSCGGGVVLRASNRELLSRMSLPIWLCASTEEILSRIEDFSTRPLINSKAPAQSFNDLFLERKLHYAEVAQLVIDTEGESPQKIAQRIADEISATWPN
jgi:shikimate dehydrogenase